MRHRTRLAAVTAAIAALIAAPIAPASAADPAGTATVPALTAPDPYPVVRASNEDRVLFDNRSGGSEYATLGAPSTTAYPYSVPEGDSIYLRSFVGHQAMMQDDSTYPSVFTFVNLQTGSTNTLTQTDDYYDVFNTGTGYVASIFSEDFGSAIKYQAWGSSAVTWTYESGDLFSSILAADAAGVLYVGKTEASGYARDYVEYREFATGTATRLWTSSSDDVTVDYDSAMSTGLFAWTTAKIDPDSGDAIELRLNARPRVGGSVVNRLLPASLIGEWIDLFASGSYVALRTEESLQTLALANLGGSTPWVTVPGDGEGAAPGGFLVGNYDTGRTDYLANGASSLTTWTPIPLAPRDVRIAGFSAGTVTFERDRATENVLGYIDRDVWKRTVTGGSTPSFGAETATGIPLDHWQVSTSGRRDAFIDQTNELLPAVVVRDGGVETLRLPRASGANLKVSGPYVRMDNQIIGTSSSRWLYDLPRTAFKLVDIFGSRVVWMDRQSGTVSTVDVATGASATTLVSNPCGAGEGAHDLAFWGRTVVIACPEAPSKIIDVYTKAVKTGPVLPYFGEAFSLGDGFMAVTAVDDAGAVVGVDTYDLTATNVAASKQALVTDSDAYPVKVDGHHVAWTSNGEVKVAPAPVASASQKPRFLGASGEAAFSPNGDGVQDNWTPGFDATKALGAWTLTIKNSGGTAVRTFSGTANDSGIRGVSWDGKNGSNVAQPDGTYTWVLTAAAQDGEGALVTAGGASTVSGTVAVRRTSTVAATVKAPVNVATATTALATPLSWSPAAALPTGIQASTYDVQYRTMKIVGTQRVYGPATLWKTTGSTGSTFTGVPGTSYQFSARVRDTSGAVGPWGTWVTSNTPFDDRKLTVKSMYDITTSGAWLSTQRYGKADGAYAQASTYVTGYTVVATRCKACGDLNVYIDGKFAKKVSTYATANQYRREVYTVSLAPGKHTIRVVADVSTARPKVYVDAMVAKH